MIDGGGPITVLSGVHVGCFELFGNEGIRNITDLKGKTVGVAALGSSDHLFVSVMAAHIGLDPASDIRWVTSQSPSPAELFADGKIDAYLGLPPVPQELRARNIGHVVVDSAMDRPWSEYFCCMLAGHRDYVQKNPIATKRVLRAILKGADLCAGEPERAARRLVDVGFTASSDYALQTMRDVPYDKWREYDPEDTVRYYALRLHDLGFVKSTPQKIIGDGTDSGDVAGTVPVTSRFSTHLASVRLPVAEPLGMSWRQVYFKLMILPIILSSGKSIIRVPSRLGNGAPAR